jgi:hypothetical protein
MESFPSFYVDPSNPIRIHHYANFRINGIRHRLYFYADTYLLMVGDGYDHPMVAVPKDTSILSIMRITNVKNAESPILIDSWCTEEVKLPYNNDIFADRHYLLEMPVATMQKEYTGLNATIRTYWG